ncbi:hypothetical protein CC78DRAFT_153064 [Lojkania enalia]|uniref:Pre-mRNA-splicing factor n=1 Tax=Lojkania enalia TaxID=147567 RepID=A0A9P4KCU8_9PLEO|nr:hypothetical protein CC78DRAFT_153064 [Didymosphaeria enalia]
MAAPKAAGFKFSLLGAKNKNAPTTTKEPAAKRQRVNLDDDNRAPNDNEKSHIEILGWDAKQGGAVDKNAKEEKGPLVIAPLPNRDWRAEIHRKQQQATQSVNEKLQKSNIQFGLTVMQKREEPQKEANGDVKMKDEDIVEDGLTEEQRLEKEAVEVLLNGKAEDIQRIIPVQSEEETFHHDYDQAPDAPSLAAYEATPIEGFGAALLRGMGWKDGKAQDSKTKTTQIKPRPNLLGIGAKEEAAVGVELGDWSKGKGKKNKMEQSYNPLSLRNKKTGEIITQEELKRRLEQQGLVEEDKPQPKDRDWGRGRDRYEDDDDKKRGTDRKKRDYDDDYDSERRLGRKRRDREDDYDSERRRHRKQKAEDDYDSERRRERKRRDEDDYYDSERRRERRRRDEDDYDSERRRERRRRDEDEYDSERRRDRKHRDDNGHDRRRGRWKDDGRNRDRKDRYRSRSPGY